MSGSIANLEGQEFYRINQLAGSSGDIFVMDVAATAIAVGPESDFSSYDIYYFDRVTKTPQKVSVSVDQPFTGDLFAGNAESYNETKQGANGPQPTQLIITPTELYMPGALDNGMPTIFPPRIDLLFFLTIDPIIPSRRPPKRIRTPVALTSIGGATFAIPTYGRNRLTAAVVRTDALAPVLAISFASLWKFLLPVRDTGATAARVADAVAAGLAVAAGPNVWSGGFIDTQLEQGSNWVSNTGAADLTTQARGRYDYLIFVVTSDVDVDPGAFTNGGVQIYFEAYD